MLDGIFSDKAMVFIQSWKNWDTAAMRHTVSAEVAYKNNRGYFMPAMALKKETDAMVDAKNELCEELGVNPVPFMRALQELRRDGVDYGKAVRLIMSYLEHLSHDTT